MKTKVREERVGMGSRKPAETKSRALQKQPLDEYPCTTMAAKTLLVNLSLGSITARGLHDESLRHRERIADLSVPIPSEMRSVVEAEGKAYTDFPGLYLAHLARNKGYRSRQVVVYSVHDSATVAELAARIGVCYITKGRPKMLKTELDNILSYDPTRDK